MLHRSWRHAWASGACGCPSVRRNSTRWTRYGDKERMRSARINSSPQSTIRSQRSSTTSMGYRTKKHCKPQACAHANSGSGAQWKRIFVHLLSEHLHICFWKIHNEFGTLVNTRASRFNVPAMQVHEFMYQCQANSQATWANLGRVPHLHVHVEYILQHVVRYAYPVVCDSGDVAMSVRF